MSSGLVSKQDLRGNMELRLKIANQLVQGHTSCESTEPPQKKAKLERATNFEQCAVDYTL